MGYEWGETERGPDKRPNQIYGMPRGADATLRTLDMHKTREYVVEKPTDKVSVAFLGRAPNKFAEGLASGDAVKQLNTLDAISKWLLSAPKNKVSQVEAGGVELVTALVTHSDTAIRELATKVLAQLLSVQQGVARGIHCGVVDAALVAIEDTSVTARRHAHATLQLLGNYPEGIDALVAAGAVARLVHIVDGKFRAPEPLQSLKVCVRSAEGLAAALAADGTKVVVGNIRRESPGGESGEGGDALVLQGYLVVLTLLTSPPEAKEQAIAEGAVPLLVALLKHREQAVRTAAVGAMVSVCVSVRGKQEAFELGAADLLIALLFVRERATLMLTVKTLGLLAECRREVLSTPLDGAFRATFDKALPQLATLAASEDLVLAKCARDTADLINWRP